MSSSEHDLKRAVTQFVKKSTTRGAQRAALPKVNALTKTIIRVVREQQQARIEARAKLKATPKRKYMTADKSRLQLTLELIAQRPATRSDLYQKILQHFNIGPNDQERKAKLVGGVNQALHQLAIARMVKKESEKGGKFSLTAKGRKAIA
jgi:hypothetical protein